MTTKSELLDAIYPYDIVINGVGYLLARQIIPNLPFRTQRARYGYTPTFIERTNVSNGYGDNQQDFWLTVSQNDWSLGLGQKYYDGNDPEKSRKYWQGGAISTSVPGQAFGQYGQSTSAFASPVQGAAAIDCNLGSFFYTTTSTNLYQVDPSSGFTSLGAHGASAVCTAFAFDGDFLYMSSGANVRKYNVNTGSIASYSSTGAESLLYMNNTLYGVKGGVLSTYASSGTATASFTFKDASGTALNNYTSKLASLGGKVLVLRQSAGSDSLWEWDGTGMSMLASFPANFQTQDFCVNQGIVFVLGIETSTTPDQTNCAAVWFYENGNIGRTYITQRPTDSFFQNHNVFIAAFGDGFLFYDPFAETELGAAAIMYYNIATGSVENLAIGGFQHGTQVAVNNEGFMFVQISTGTGKAIFGGGGLTSKHVTSAELISSLYDFGSSLTKYIRGVTVNYDAGVDGSSLDIYYQLNDVQNGNWTLLQTDAQSAVEYEFPAGTIGNSIGIRLLLNNPNGATDGTTPTIKRLYVRAAPIQTQFRTGEYVLDFSGRDGKTPVMRRDGRPEARTGPEMLTQLVADITADTPFTITDRLGTFTGVAELDQLEIIELKPEEYWVHLIVRGV